MAQSIWKRTASDGRRFVPPPLVGPVVELRTRRALRRPEVLVDARAQMHFLLGAAAPHVDVDEVVPRYVRHMRSIAERRWHPRTITGQRVEGAEHLLAARDEGAGVVLSFMHHGYSDGLAGSMRAVGVPIVKIVASTLLSDSADSYLRQQGRLSRASGGVIDVAVGSEAIVRTLEQGNVVSLASDVPGRTPVRFVGRDLVGSFGAARLAARVGCPVVLATAHREPGGTGLEAFYRLAPALHPQDHGSPKELLTVMLEHHEKAVLAWPEATDQPLMRWGDPTSDS